MADEVARQIKNWLAHASKIVVAGIGNPIRTDDNVGLKIVEDLKGKLSEKVLLLEAETVPENYLQEIEEFHPSHVLLIDAAVQGLKPGALSLVDAEKISAGSAVTTHVLPLRVFCDVVKQATGAKIALLLVEPQNMDFGEGLTPPVQTAAENVVKLLLNLLGSAA